MCGWRILHLQRHHAVFGDKGEDLVDARHAAVGSPRKRGTLEGSDVHVLQLALPADVRRVFRQAETALEPHVVGTENLAVSGHVKVALETETVVKRVSKGEKRVFRQGAAIPAMAGNVRLQDTSPVWKSERAGRVKQPVQVTLLHFAPVDDMPIQPPIRRRAFVQDRLRQTTAIHLRLGIWRRCPPFLAEISFETHFVPVVPGHHEGLRPSSQCSRIDDFDESGLPVEIPVKPFYLWPMPKAKYGQRRPWHGKIRTPSKTLSMQFAFRHSSKDKLPGKIQSAG